MYLYLSESNPQQQNWFAVYWGNHKDSMHTLTIINVRESPEKLQICFIISMFVVVPMVLILIYRYNSKF